MARFKCPLDKVIFEKEKSKCSTKQLWYKKRNYCLNECESGCDVLIMLKKIYWELRKPK